jgi:hypothetical protein
MQDAIGKRLLNYQIAMGAHRKQSFMLLGIPDISKKVDYDPDLFNLSKASCRVSCTGIQGAAF